MFNENFVVSLKVNGKIVREDKDLVKLPFNSEYTILLKNLNSRNAKVTIDIDGDNVTDGSVIIPANDSAELTGYIYNAKITNAFKFIEKTKKISNYRGDKIDDGLIRIEYTFEKEKPIFQSQPYWNVITEYHPPKPMIPMTESWTTYSTDNSSPNLYQTCRSMSSNTIIGAKSKSSMMPEQIGLAQEFHAYNNSIVEDGITVKGSEINKELDVGTLDELEKISHVIIMRIKGYQKFGRKVTKVITTKQKIICKTCGTANRSNHKFCTQCGTFLQ